MGKDVILFLEQLVAFEALREFAFAIDFLVGGERLILPLAVSKLSGTFGAPAGPLLHDRIADEITSLRLAGRLR